MTQEVVGILLTLLTRHLQPAFSTETIACVHYILLQNSFILHTNDIYICLFS